MATLTVAQLIDLLKAMPQDAPVQVEGCDCFQNAETVELQGARGQEGSYVLIGHL